MRVKLIEPFLTGSHKQWAEGLRQHSKHEISIASLNGNHWKWRMHGSAISFSQNLDKEARPDLILCTDMTDVATFKGLLPTRWQSIPISTYFHENQITYPWSRNDPDKELKRDHHYGWINYTSALASDRVLFNSDYHLNSFLDALPGFLDVFPDYQNLETVDQIRSKSEVLHLGLDLTKFDQFRGDKIHNRILWNHRWEYDKNPESFFKVLFQLADEGVEFELAVCGERFSKTPPIFEEAQTRLSDKIVQFGTLDSFEEYSKLLWSCGIVPVTSNQDFFGISAVEAMYCECTPLLPNRLAFPTHLNQPHLLFNDDSELLAKLRDLLVLQEPTNCRPDILRYDWSSQIERYDSVLEGIAKSTTEA